MPGNRNQSITTATASTPYSYRFGPFDLHSTIPIVELQGLTGQGGIPVHIVTADVPETIADASPFGQYCWVAPTEYLLAIPHVGRFHVAHGNKVRVEIAPDAPAADLSTYLLGSVFGALCHQNGLLPLHASAVLLGGAATAFLGQSGAGKSTLAACLKDRGHPVVSDDICVLTGDPVRVIPVAGWLKLWRASFQHLGTAPDEKNRVLRANDKFRMYLAGETDTTPEAGAADRPTLENLVFLARSETPDEPATLVPIPAAEAIAWMLRLTYLGYITDLTGSHARVFLQCAQVLAGARAWRLTVPWGFHHMDEVLDLLESTLASAAHPR
jgi:hypothetical protein